MTVNTHCGAALWGHCFMLPLETPWWSPSFQMQKPRFKKFSHLPKATKPGSARAEIQTQGQLT